MTTTSKITAAALLASGMFAAGLAQAQSHSVVNYSNPPNVQADSKAATDATPGLTATADQQDARHPNKGIKDAAANQGSKGSNSAKTKRHASKGPQQRPASAAASKDGSQSATASVAMDGASKGGAEATMQTDPSESEPNKSATHAFDTTPSKK